MGSQRSVVCVCERERERKRERRSAQRRVCVYACAVLHLTNRRGKPPLRAPGNQGAPSDIC